MNNLSVPWEEVKSSGRTLRLGGGCAHLPGMVREIIAHLLPWMACAARICRSSSAVNGPRFTVGVELVAHDRS